MSVSISSVPISQGDGRRVLLVDDNAAQLKLNRLRLEDAGFAVTTAASVREAFEHVRVAAPDVILSDVVMGEVDGFTLLKRVREQPQLAAVPVILLSAHFEEARDPDLAMQLGAAALVKRTPDFGAEMSALCSALAAPTPTRDDQGPRAFERLLRSSAREMSKLVARANRSEERYQTLLEHANDTVTLLTPDGIILEANARWQSVLGFDPAELIGKHIREFAAPTNEAANDQNFNQHVAGADVSMEPVAIRHAQGHIVQMEFSVTVREVAGEPIVLAIGRDVTDRVRAHAELAKAEQKYRMLVERVPDVIWTATEDGALIYVTRSVEGVLGYTQQELCRGAFGSRMEDVHPEDQDLVRRAFEALGSNGTAFDVEYRRRHKDGHWVWVRNRAAGSYEHAGVRYFDGILSDVSERKRLEESLLHAQKLEAIGQLTGGIAHDFNNVLAAILGNSHFLIEALDPQDPRRADAEEIKLAAERAATLTRQLLAFSRKQVLEPSTMSLNGIVSGIEKMLWRLIGEDIELTIEKAAEVGNVRVDVGQIEQVIVNLAVNARDAMPHGGKLDISTAEVDLTDPVRAAEAGASPGRYVCLTVRDEGSGMSAETKARVFEPFFTTKGAGRGTGLGLATCYGVVQQSGGFITVQSELGNGSVFSVYLPCEDAPEQRLPPRLDGVELNGSETILLIEDDASVRAAVRRMLERRGYRVLVAKDGPEAFALTALSSEPVDLVLSDVVMPGGSGPDTVQSLRAHGASLKALFMSGYTSHAALPKEAEDGATHYIQKPFTPDALAKKVRQVLSA